MRSCREYNSNWSAPKRRAQPDRKRVAAALQIETPDYRQRIACVQHQASQPAPIVWRKNLVQECSRPIGHLSFLKAERCTSPNRNGARFPICVAPTPGFCRHPAKEGEIKKWPTPPSGGVSVLAARFMT